MTREEQISSIAAVIDVFGLKVGQQFADLPPSYAIWYLMGATAGLERAVEIGKEKNESLR